MPFIHCFFVLVRSKGLRIATLSLLSSFARRIFRPRQSFRAKILGTLWPSFQKPNFKKNQILGGWFLPSHFLT